MMVGSKYLILLGILLMGDIIHPSNRLYNAFSLHSFAAIGIAMLCCYCINRFITSDNHSTLSVIINICGAGIFAILFGLCTALVGDNGLTTAYDMLIYIIFEVILGEFLFVVYLFVLTVY